LTKIARVQGREVFDSRGRPTVEVEMICEGARPARSIAPSGASTGAAEAREVRDGGPRLNGLGVRRAVENVNAVLGPALVGLEADDQQAIDRRLCELDGTPDKSRLGANAIVACSLATAYACAEARNQTPADHLHQLWREHQPATGADDQISLPMPMVNLISGGLHAGRNLDFQDFLIIPVGATRFAEALDWIIEVYQRLGRILAEDGYEGVLVGDEGGYGPKLDSADAALDFVMQAIERAGLQPGRDIGLALDVAATHFFEHGVYRLTAGGKRQRLSSDEMIAELTRLADAYPILSIEDGLAEDDWSGWQSLTAQLGARMQLIGDDLFATNVERIRRGIAAGIANSVLIKLNQIGTLTETLAAMRFAIDHGYRPVISARSGETEDVTIADLAVATAAGQIKIGSVARSERLAKYNQLLRLDDRYGARAPFARFR
jgi:enolase